MSLGQSLQQRLFESVFRNEYRREAYPIDFERFPPSPPPSLPRRAASRLKGYLWSTVFEASFRRMAATQVGQIGSYLALLPRLEALYEKLGDAQSKETLLAVLSYRILGRHRYAMPLNTAEYWQKRESLRALVASPREVQLSFMGWKLAHYDLKPIDFPIEVLNRASGLQAIFLLEQYRYRHSVGIAADEGDYVIDAGGCWGEVALYFAHRVGADGRVFTFEFIPANTRILRDNLSLNPALEARIQLVEHPVWRHSGVTMHFDDNGPGSRVGLEPVPNEAGSVTSVALSDFAEEQKLPRVDFIKMDIEGAELEALRGAEELLRKFRPKLAISVYHKPEHLVEIAEYLTSLNLGYRFYLDHFTTFMEETVLFATAR